MLWVGSTRFSFRLAPSSLKGYAFFQYMHHSGPRRSGRFLPPLFLTLWRNWTCKFPPFCWVILMAVFCPLAIMRRKNPVVTASGLTPRRSAGCCHGFSVPGAHF